MVTFIPLGTIGSLYNEFSGNELKLSVVLSCEDVTGYKRKKFIFLHSEGTIRRTTLFHDTVKKYSIT